MTDRYRPTTFDGIVGQPTDEIERLLNGADSPNFLFHGPPGTGKTTTAYVIAREIQGGEGEVMEFNASDERGIDTVRENIIPAANQTTLTGKPRVIFLDEMDSMTKDAQEALRRPMEQAKAVFVLACNDVEAVHSALKSRAYEYEFGEVSDAEVRRRVKQLATEYDADLSQNALNTIVGFANGDVRSAVQQFDAHLRGAVADDGDGGQDTLDGNTLEGQARQFLQE